MVEVHFNNIRSKILYELESAQTNILVAVYWFTNQELFDILLKKCNAGIDIGLIIHNDYINNRDTGLPFQQLIDAGGEFYFSDEDNPMHNKFCVIDKKTVINGSYNWTYYAESKNRENILIIKNEEGVSDAFESEFNRLAQLLEPLKTIRHITKFEVEENNTLTNRDYLAHDIIFKAKAINKPEIVKYAFEIAPNNLSIQKIANDLDLIKKYKLKHSIGIEIVNDGVKIMANKGASIPATFSTILRTSYSNQTKSVSDVVYGEHEKASKNTALAKMILDSLPEKPKGEAEVKFSFSIDIDGKLRIETMSLDNGKKEVVSQIAQWLIEEN